MTATRPATATDPITLEIIQSSLQAASDEMFAAFRKTAMSAIIYEVLDMGTGITDGEGNLASSGAGIPAFVGVLDKAVRRIIELHDPPDVRPGDIFVTNDPFYGGVTHLNDVVLAMPVFADGELVAWTANIAHWNDVGGMVPGSISNEAKQIFQEGLRLPAVKLISQGEPIRSVMEIMKVNSRLPDFLQGDMWAGIAAARVGERRIVALVEKYGLETFKAGLRTFMDYGEQVARRALPSCRRARSRWPRSRTAAPSTASASRSPTTSSSSTSVTTPTRIRARTTPRATGPWSRTDDLHEHHGRARLRERGTLPSAQGSDASRIRLRRKPARGVRDLLRGRGAHLRHDVALPRAAPRRPPARRQLRVDLRHVHRRTAPGHRTSLHVVEPQVGGWGGSASRDGNSAIFSGFHGDTFNCPAEVAEARYGLYVEQLRLNDEPGGEGEHRGGKGIVLDYRVRSNGCFFTCAYTRNKQLPWPLEGGNEGSPNYAEVIRADGSVETHAVVTALTVNEGDVIRLHTATGGGFGDAPRRARELVLDDLRNGYLSEERARAVYGLDG